jgi:hypothetical protein
MFCQTYFTTRQNDEKSQDTSAKLIQSVHRTFVFHVFLPIGVFGVWDYLGTALKWGKMLSTLFVTVGP